MITVGIRNLKNSLSQYLKMVKRGERIVVTDHNRIVAQIVPVSVTDEKASILENYILDKIQTGKLSPATKKTTLRRERKTEDPVDQKEIERIYEQTRNDRQ
jgi:prevent-host-death family protein